ncbi:MAG TPA: isochorismate synthase [bacterium]|nr:isochorismate synthase [bacterium]
MRRAVLACAAVPAAGLDPLTVFERSGRQVADRWLLLRPGDRWGVVGLGAAWTFVCDGVERFARARDAWRDIAGHAVDEDPGNAPFAFYGFAFEDSGVFWDGYPSGLLVAPRVAVQRRGDDARVLVSALVHPDSRASEEADRTLECLRNCVRNDGTAGEAATPPPLQIVDEFPSQAAWKRSVTEAADAVRAGRLRKVVLARGIRVEGGRPDAAAAARTLRREYPACTTFAIGRGDRCFLGASPERLVRVHDDQVLVAALAGSAPRGRTAPVDRDLAAGLLRSEKDRIEHALVVEALRDALTEIAAGVSAAGAPELLTVHNTHHLYTPLRACLREPRSVLDLIGRLHPTPAVGGVPRDAALAWIRRHEGWDRGWYAGPVGWIQGTAGEGEAAVAIRCALVEPGGAQLFAGCGIVADSDPEQELAESGWKLRPLLSALSA